MTNDEATNWLMSILTGEAAPLDPGDFGDFTRFDSEIERVKGGIILRAPEETENGDIKVVEFMVRLERKS